MYIQTTTWQPSTVYAALTSGPPPSGLPTYVTPTPANANGLLFRVKVAGTTGGSEPTWPVALGGTVVDGSVTWVAGAAAPLICQRDLEDRLSRACVRAILDDNNDGFSDGGPILRIIADATSYVIGLIGGVFQWPLGSPVPNELQRICLDVAVGYLAIRHPEIVRYDGGAMLDRARIELKDVQRGASILDTPPMAAGANAPAPVEPIPGNRGGLIRDGSVRMVVNGIDGTNNNTLL